MEAWMRIECHSMRIGCVHMNAHYFFRIQSELNSHWSKSPPEVVSMRIQTESSWMRIGCALVVFTWAVDQLALPRLRTWLINQRPSNTCLWSVWHQYNLPVSPSFALLTSTTTHTWHKTSLLLASLPREGFLSCDFLSTPTFYIGDSVWMRIETTSGGDFDQCEFNSLWMRIEIMRIHVNTTNAHRMHIRCASMPPCERALIVTSIVLFLWAKTFHIGEMW